MQNPKILFTVSNDSFNPASRLRGQQWIDSSYSQKPDAIGKLRLPQVSNGRYEKKHPILNPNGDTIGYLPDAQNSLRYTYNCLYAGNCFWISHVISNKFTNVSLVEDNGTFLFSSKRKFGVVNSFEFGPNWTSKIKAFKLLNSGRELLYLTNYGFCLFNINRRNVIAQTEFANDLAHSNWDFIISPKVNMLAIAASMPKEKDPVDGEYYYKNFIRLYDLDTGELMGEQLLATEDYAQWSIDFDEGGRLLKLTSKSSTLLFKLSAS